MEVEVVVKFHLLEDAPRWEAGRLLHQVRKHAFALAGDEGHVAAVEATLIQNGRIVSNTDA